MEKILKNKKSIQGLAALLVLMFHFAPKDFLIPNLSKIAFIGVDIFFFISAYTLSNSTITNYFDFIKKRLLRLYIPFISFTLIYKFYKKITWVRVLKILLGVEFFKKGGGSFLWYINAIAILYLIMPFLKRIKDKLNPVISFAIMSLLWLGIAIVFQKAGLKQLFIIINRLPVVIVGLHYDSMRKVTFHEIGEFFTFIISSIFLVYSYTHLVKYSVLTRLNKPFVDSFYIVGIPFVLMIVEMMRFLPNKSNTEIAKCNLITKTLAYLNKVLEFIGSISLELYGLQMIFGFTFFNSLSSKISNINVRFLAVCAILILMSKMLNIIMSKIQKEVFVLLS